MSKETLKTIVSRIFNRYYDVDKKKIFKNKKAQDDLQALKEAFDSPGTISDGYHTFDELYDHRIVLFLSLISMAKMSGDIVQTAAKFHYWWSKLHHDGTSYDGWIIVGITNTATEEDITYHLPEKHIPYLKKMNVYEYAKAPKWDGHTSQDVVDRLTRWFLNH